MSLFDEGISFMAGTLAIVSVIGGTLSVFSMLRTLRERKIYSQQVRTLFMQVLDYSLTTNEAFLNDLWLASEPVKTYEVYFMEIEAMKNNLALVSKIDLSRVTEIYQKNIQAYLYLYLKYIGCAEEYLIRLKKRSDYLKEVMENKHDYRSIRFDLIESDSDNPIEDFLHSEYGVDYIIVEQGSVIQKDFIELLENLRITLQELLATTQKEKISQASDIKSIYLNLLSQNEELNEKNRYKSE